MLQQRERAIALGHWVPFAIWIAGLLLLQGAEYAGWQTSWLAPRIYVGKTLLCGGLLLYWRPWRAYAATRPADWLAGVAVGAVVALLWLLPETPWLAARAPAWQHFYHRWLITPLGGWPDYYDPTLFPALPANHPSLAFAPALAGWPLFLGKVVGSVVVIAAVEEFFFRGFLYRWLRSAPFLQASLDYDATTFWLVVALFAVEHDRWLMGAVAGALYGGLVVRSRRLGSAIIAHATTNLMIALYVVATGQWGFW